MLVRQGCGGMGSRQVHSCCTYTSSHSLSSGVLLLLCAPCCRLLDQLLI